MIRSATVEDAAAIGRIKVRSWRSAYAEFMAAPLLGALDPVQEAADWAAYVTTMPGGHRLWVAEGDGAVVGFCRTGPADHDPDLGTDAGEVYGLYVDPGHVGTGFGRQLFSHAVEELRARGRRPVCVYAYRPNAHAVRFYQRAGFSLDGTTRLDDADPIGVAEVRLVDRR
ncbi:GNAT family N-acetyltransferase [Catellatospora sp. NPDC049111]|uniref:GNAT family N-acetyltransferase n=1 Tax=Catellatospora sp. NPDC049111 TaxID=3155271 RepID=UPI0033E93EF3